MGFLCLLLGHKKGVRPWFHKRTSVITGKVQELYHCKRCQGIMAFDVNVSEVEND